MHILRLNHVITGNEYLRHKSFHYISEPKDLILKWTSIRYIFVSVWAGKTFREIFREAIIKDQYEFIEFDDEFEEYYCYTYKYMNHKINYESKLMDAVFQSWVDWDDYVIKTMHKDEIDYVLNTPSNLCPICKEGTIVKNHCSNCSYSYNIRGLTDLDRRYREVYNNMEALKKAIDRAGLHNLNMKFIKMEMGR